MQYQDKIRFVFVCKQCISFLSDEQNLTDVDIWRANTQCPYDFFGCYISSDGRSFRMGGWKHGQASQITVDITARDPKSWYVNVCKGQTFCGQTNVANEFDEGVFIHPIIRCSIVSINAINQCFSIFAINSHWALFWIS